MLGLYWGYIGILEKKMETTIVYWYIYTYILGLLQAKLWAEVVGALWTLSSESWSIMCRSSWVAVKELKLSYHNGYM